jgi:hypothetical protein
MKNDASRNTFDPRKHYSSVRMQQGRVQIDADWNEQGDIITHRVRMHAFDSIDFCGGPLHHAAFHIVGSLGQLTAEEQSLPGNQIPPSGFAVPDFLISAGHYYVGGILCENEKLTSYLHQPDLPAPVAIDQPGLYLVYVDVWHRHLTALDDPTIREIALGGSDTATRTKTVWQIKYWFAGETAGNCLTEFSAFQVLIAPGSGKLSARTKQEEAGTNPCIVPPGAGYLGLENQLYRVEVHEGGEALDVTAGSGTAVTRVSESDNQLKYSGGTWQAGQAVEVFTGESGSYPLNGVLGYITAVDTGEKTVTLSINVSSLPFDDLRVRHAKATYTWSRDNGIIVTSIENMDGAEITVHDLGPDAVLGFKEGQWVEIIDDRLELNGSPGQLAQISTIDRAVNLITLSSSPAPLDSSKASGVNKARHPKLRGWDGAGAIKFHPSTTQDHFIDIENGVQVRFSAGTFKTGDYWNIPARSATADTQSGNIEWPVNASNAPVAQLPFGIKHYYCRLAMLHWNGTAFNSIEDCRNLFPPVTELTSLFYVGGDGQEAMPNEPLPQLLQAGVFNGRWPVSGAMVRFTAQGAGRLAANIAGLASSATNTITVPTGPDGIASCAWRLEADVAKRSQQVEARLLDAGLAPMPPIVRYNGNLSMASQVFYDPGDCATLAGRDTVQEAIDQLADLISLYDVSGNNQEVMPGGTLQQLRVLAANACGPVAGQNVKFEIAAGNGQVTPQATTDASGIAAATWTLDPGTRRQEVLATIVGSSATSTKPPQSVRFVANLSIASQVAYDPKQCPDLAKANTVQEAIDELCKRAETVDPGVRITSILTETDGKSLDNDVLVPVGRLSKGILIKCDRPLAPESVGRSPDPPSKFPEADPAKPTCILTVDLPFPLGNEAEFWGTNSVVGFETIAVACTVKLVEPEVIQWTPTSPANQWLQQVLFTVLNRSKAGDRVLAHLTLKGNFIWSNAEGGAGGKTLLYLDGDAFGVESANKRTGLRLPSGNGRGGGDFEMWFWLVPSQAPTTGIVLTVNPQAAAVFGSVKDASGAVIAAAAITMTNNATGAVRTATTNSDGNFVFEQVPKGSYTVVAKAGNQTAQAVITV